MRWGCLEDCGRPSSEPPLVYFGGYTELTVFGLGGSTRHIVGCDGMSSTTSRSAAPFLINHLLEGLGIDKTGWTAYSSHGDEVDPALQAAAVATFQLRPPTCEMEFIARTLVDGRAHHPFIHKSPVMHCVLGTPIYVASLSGGVFSDPWANLYLPANDE